MNPFFTPSGRIALMKPPARIVLFLSALATIWFTGAETRGAGGAGAGGSNSGASGGANRLIHEKSPYLLRHKDNPIWWSTWGDGGFRAGGVVL